MSKKSSDNLVPLFPRFVLSDLRRAKIKDSQLLNIVRDTVNTTIAFIRSKRREVLADEVIAQQLAKLEARFENTLLRSIVLAIPRKKRNSLR